MQDTEEALCHILISAKRIEQMKKRDPKLRRLTATGVVEALIDRELEKART